MKLLKILLLLIIPLGLYANETIINGAFGVNFGQEFPDSDEVVVQFTPKFPISAFDEYSVRLTPKSKRVYSIIANHKSNDSHSFDQRMQQCGRLLTLYRKKYTEPYSSLVSFSGVDDNFNTIQLDCFAEELILTSKEFLKIAEDERIEFLNKEFEKSGL